jgi:hypothetical protein
MSGSGRSDRLAPRPCGLPPFASTAGEVRKPVVGRLPSQSADAGRRIPICKEVGLAGGKIVG